MLTDNAVAQDQWNSYVGDGTEYGATFVGKIAWADSVGCVACHSKMDPNLNQPMFPHALSAVNEYTDSSPEDPKGIWLEKASYAGADDTAPVLRADKIYWDDQLHSDIASDTGAATAQGRWGGAADGVCMKCHRAGDAGVATDGVGITY